MMAAIRIEPPLFPAGALYPHRIQINDCEVLSCYTHGDPAQAVPTNLAGSAFAFQTPV